MTTTKRQQRYPRPMFEPPFGVFQKYMTRGREKLARHVVGQLLLQMKQFSGLIPQGIEFEINQLNADEGMLTVTCALDGGPAFEIYMWSICGRDRWFDFVFRVEATWGCLPGGQAVFEPSQLRDIIGFEHVEGAAKWVEKATLLGWLAV